MVIRQLTLPCILLAVAGASARVQGQSAADSVRALDRAWAQAYATHDTAAAEALFADDVVVTSSGGHLKDKAGELADVRPTPGLTMEFFLTNEVRVRLRKETAVITGVAAWAFRFKGKRSELLRRYTAVYVRGGVRGWQLLALHLGPTPADSSAG
jgi:ketosteroid isomerase-like protein